MERLVWGGRNFRVGLHCSDVGHRECELQELNCPELPSGGESWWRPREG